MVEALGSSRLNTKYHMRSRKVERDKGFKDMEGGMGMDPVRDLSLTSVGRNSYLQHGPRKSGKVNQHGKQNSIREVLRVGQTHTKITQ